MEKDLLSNEYIGRVEDNQDPKKLGRIKVRVLNVFDDIPVGDIPWATPNKDLNGNQFILPEVGKIVNVTFDNGKFYTPVYNSAQHYNVNLEKKLTSLSGDDYSSMRTLMFDHRTQIFSNDSDGLMIDYKYNQINITNFDIDVKLKSNFGKLSLGTNNATQEAILGTNFLNWFDEFVENLLGQNAGPYLGNLGAPIIPNPALINVLLKYRALKDPKFLSNNVYFNDNGYITRPKRSSGTSFTQKGDDWRSTVEENELVEKSGDNVTPDNTSPQWTPEGTLTPASDGSPTSILSDEQIDQQAPASDVNPDTEVLIEILKDKGYKIYERPFEINTIGVRYQYPGQEYSNKFKDRIYALYKDESGKWVVKYWMVSTIPGRNKSWRKGSPLLKDAVGKKRGGLGILKPAQYVNVYYIGYHREENKSSRAMKTVGKQLAYRDQNYGSNKITYSNEDPNNAKGGRNFAMYIHKAYTLKSGKGYNVNNWSEGCQVFPDSASLNEYFDLCEIHKKRYKNRFTYTLITSKDVEDMEIKLKQKGDQAQSEAGSGGSGRSNGNSSTGNKSKEEISFDSYKRIVTELKTIYAMNDKGKWSKGRTKDNLFDDFSGTFTDDVEGAVKRIYELLGLSDRNRSKVWYSLLPLDKLTKEHKELFLNQLSGLKRETIEKSNSFKFNLPTLKPGEGTKSIEINPDF